MSKVKSPSVRLQKYIADCGVTSRRKAEVLIEEGRVEVNGDVVLELGTKVTPGSDTIYVDGTLIDLKSVQKHYILLNKPRGYLATVHDPQGRPIVLDLVKEISDRIYPVGRLDYYSEGLLLLTNDGELANLVIHPSSDIHKVYEVKVFGKVTHAILKQLRNGVVDNGETLTPKSVRVVKELKQKTWLEFRLTEGKNREIRRICEACGLTIDKLKRVAIESLTIDGIGMGKYAYLTKKQILSKLGINERGERIKPHAQYHSEKKTIKLSGRKLPKHELNKASATDEKFLRYRRDQYQETMKIHKEVEDKAREKAIEEDKAEKLEANRLRLERIKRIRDKRNKNKYKNKNQNQ